MLKKHIMCVLLLLIYLKIKWEPKHIMINLFMQQKQ